MWDNQLNWGPVALTFLEWYYPSCLSPSETLHHGCLRCAEPFCWWRSTFPVASAPQCIRLQVVVHLQGVLILCKVNMIQGSKAPAGLSCHNAADSFHDHWLCFFFTDMKHCIDYTWPEILWACLSCFFPIIDTLTLMIDMKIVTRWSCHLVLHWYIDLWLITI